MIERAVLPGAIFVDRALAAQFRRRAGKGHSAARLTCGSASGTLRTWRIGARGWHSLLSGSPSACRPLGRKGGVTLLVISVQDLASRLLFRQPLFYPGLKLRVSCGCQSSLPLIPGYPVAQLEATINPDRVDTSLIRWVRSCRKQDLRISCEMLKTADKPGDKLKAACWTQVATVL